MKHLRLVTVPMPQVESVTVLVGVGAGSRYEQRRINGLSHFLEHMAFKGTKKRPTTLAISSAVDAVGGEFNAFTDKELTGYWLKLAAKHAALAFDILADILTNSLLRPEEIEREKGVILEEINMLTDTPRIYVTEIFERLIYGDNPMGWDVAGEKETIKKIKRNDFLKYIDRLYYPRNMMIAVAGGLTENAAEKLTRQYFGLLRKAGQKVTKQIKIEQEKPRLKLVYRKTEQAHFCLGIPGYSLVDGRRWALAVLAAVLGGGMSSRLFIEIRERRGLAYYVGSEVAYYTDSGFLVNHAGVKLSQAEEAIRVTLGQMQLLAEKKVGAKELSKAKEMLKGHLILSLEDSKNVAARVAEQLLLEGKVRTVDQTLSLIDKVTAEDVQRVARDLFRAQKLNLTVIGPYKNEAKFAKLLER